MKTESSVEKETAGADSMFVWCPVSLMPDWVINAFWRFVEGLPVFAQLLYSLMYRIDALEVPKGAVRGW